MDIYGNEVYNINQTLKEQNEIFREVLGIMKNPENPVIKVLQVMVLITGIMEITIAIEVIISWIKGGL